MLTALSLLPFIKKYRKWLLLSAACHVGMAFFTVFSIPMIIPFFRILFNRDVTHNNISNMGVFEGRLNEVFTNLIVIQGSKRAMILVCLALVTAFFFRNAFRYLSLIFMAPLRNGIVCDLRNNIHTKLLYLPLHFFNEENKGDLMSRTTMDVQEVDWSILSMIEAVFKSPFIIIGSLSFMILINIKLTLFAILLMLFTGVIIAGISRRLKRDSQNIQSRIGALTTIIEESLHGLRIVKLFSAQRFRENKFIAENQKFYLLSNNFARKRELSSPLSEFFGVSIVVLLLWFGSSLVFKNELLPETFFAFILAFYQLIEPTKQLSNAMFSLQKGSAALNRINEVLQYDEEIEEQDTSITQLSFRNSIEIINLSFSYPNTNQKALDTINLCILKGEKIGIIGKSGSGKSSLVDVLLRLQDNYSGKILLDGSDIRSLPLTPYRRLFGVVSQESILFNDAIKDNITLNTPYDIERMVHVLQVANLDELISQKDEGIHYTIGERGGLLSGGERQRLTIARALYQNPPILLLDEATNALDAQSEGIVKEALYKALENRTALIIAHNLSLLSEVDRVLVLEDGKIIKEGSYNEILDSVN